MEPVGSAVGVVTLAGLFNNAVDCFGYVQVGGSEMKDVRSLQSAFGYERDVTKAERLIGQILELLADAEGVWQREYGINTGLAQSRMMKAWLSKSTSRHGDEGCYAPPEMRELSIKHQNQASLHHEPNGHYINGSISRDSSKT